MATGTSPGWSGAANASERVTRHRAIDRLYHWLMAAAVLVLMGTAFLPILGWKFEWLDIHWMTGVLLAALVLIHIVRSLVWQDWRNMWIGSADISDLWRDLRHVITGGGQSARPGKYNALQKLYHLAVAILILSIVSSGLLMLLKVDTPLWRRDPYWFSSNTWGIIYAVHGLAAMSMLTLLIIHVYFALRPDEWYLTRSMFRGWISKDEYSKHHNPARWTPDR
jgi:cytochrome b subunit of formate dehydrogenase